MANSTFQIRISDDLKACLFDKASAEGKTATAFVIELIEKAVGATTLSEHKDIEFLVSWVDKRLAEYDNKLEQIEADVAQLKQQLLESSSQKRSKSKGFG